MITFSKNTVALKLGPDWRERHGAAITEETDRFVSFPIDYAPACQGASIDPVVVAAYMQQLGPCDHCGDTPMS